MAGAARQIGMVQVVRLDPHRDEAAEQRFKHRGIVVDAAQQYTLRQHRNAAARQSPDRGADRLRQFARVIGVHDDIDRLLGTQSRDQRRTDTDRIGNRHTRVKADHRDMRYRFERLHDRGDAARRQQKRIAAREDDLPNFRAGADVIERGRKRRR